MKQKNQGLWTIKSFVIMLVVTFVGVPILIEGILQDALYSLFKNDLEQLLGLLWPLCFYQLCMG
ncbi:hypothetical protein Q4S57_07195 [Priestia megaterium]|uniref:hypothetical protein n=1 Tax=Priestia megaterium TaxID=1404 RepID=UPI0026E1B228|nr:hypothetical protein [Priestia megaterium]MDO6847735.1 hypothetical protein [Priestia megaterium]